jgi:hypothetical protein
MVDLRTATQAIMFGGTDKRRTPTSGGKLLLADGVVHVDFGDPDQVFLVSVVQVPRVRLPVGQVALGEVDGVTVHLVEASTANRLELVIEGRGQEGIDVPGWPAERLMAVPTAVTDDVGTTYRFTSAEAGGEDRPWRAIELFRPVPPPDAAMLTIDYGGQRTEIPLRGAVH